MAVLVIFFFFGGDYVFCCPEVSTFLLQIGKGKCLFLFSSIPGARTSDTHWGMRRINDAIVCHDIPCLLGRVLRRPHWFGLLFTRL